MSMKQAHPIPKQKLGKKSAPLDQRRETAAQWAYEQAPLTGVEDQDGWNADGDFYSRTVYWQPEEEGDDTVSGSFGVQFAPDSDKIIDWWWQ